MISTASFKKNFLAIPLTDIIQMIGTLLTISIFSKIDIKFFALYIMVLTIIEITNSISLFGNEKFFQKHLKENNKINKNFINDSFSLNIVISASSFIIFLIYNLIFYSNESFILSSILFLPALLNFRTFLILVYRYNKNNIPILKIKTLVVCLGLLFKYFALLFQIDIFYLCLIIFFEQALEAFLLIYFSNEEKNYLPNKLVLEISKLFNLIKILFPIGFSIIMFTFLVRIEIILINQLISPILASGFFVCVKIFNSMLIFPRSVVSYEFPKLVKSNNENLLKNLYYFYKLILLTAIIGSISTFVFGYIYLSFFIDTDLLFAKEYLIFFSIAFFLQCIAGIRNSFLILINRHNDIFLPQLLSFLGKIFFSFIFIKNFGVLGACYSFVLIEFLNMSIFNIFMPSTRKLLKMQIFSLKKI